ncbi:MAG: hypothetical protein ABEJ86_05635 [Halococcoides sp.]
MGMPAGVVLQTTRSGPDGLAIVLALSAITLVVVAARYAYVLFARAGIREAMFDSDAGTVETESPGDDDATAGADRESSDEMTDDGPADDATAPSGAPTTSDGRDDSMALSEDAAWWAESGGSVTTGSGTSRTGTIIAAVATAGALALLLAAGGSARATALAAVAGTSLGGAILARAREEPVWTALASILAPIVAVLALGALALSIVDAVSIDAVDRPALLARRVLRFVAIALAAGMASTGVVGTLRDGIGDGAVTRLWQTTVLTALPVAAVLGAVIGVRFDAVAPAAVAHVGEGAIAALVRVLLAPEYFPVRVVTLATMVALAIETTRRAVAAVPIVELWPRSQRDDIVTSFDAIQQWWYRATMIATLVASLAIASFGVQVLGASPILWTVQMAVPPLASLVAMVGAPPVRVVLLAAIALALAVLVASVVGRRLAGRVAPIAGRVGPSLVGGVAILLAALLSGPVIRGTLEVVPSSARDSVRQVVTAVSPFGIALAAALIALIVLAIGLLVVAAGIQLRIVPRRSGAGAIASAGLAIAAIVVAITAGRPLIVAGAIALAIVVWDATERGVVMRAELDAVAAPRLESVQASGTAAIAVSGALGAAVLVGGLSILPAPRLTAVGAVVAAGAVVIGLIGLRG